MGNMVIRHGDVGLRSVEALPKGVTSVKRVPRGVVLAYGEATGHAHAIRDLTATLWRGDDGREYLLVEGGVAVLQHEEHGPITISPGIYEVLHQREYTPQASRRVAD